MRKEYRIKFKIKEAMKEYKRRTGEKMTQKEICRRIDYPESNLSLYTNNHLDKIGVIQFKILEKIAEVLQVDNVEDIMCFEIVEVKEEGKKEDEE